MRLEPSHAFFHGNILIVLAERRLRGRRKNRLRQFLTFLKSGGQRNPAHLPRFPVILPAASRDVSAHDTFHRNHFQFLRLHAATGKFRFPEKFRHIRRVDGNHVIRHDVLREIKPKFTHPIQHLTFARNRLGQNFVKRGNAIRAHHHECVTDVVQFPYFSGHKRLILCHENPLP